MTDCIRIARAGVKEFPNNYVLLNKLMYALFVAGSDDADIPDWKENMEKYKYEIIELGEKILSGCTDDESGLRLRAVSVSTTVRLVNETKESKSWKHCPPTSFPESRISTMHWTERNFYSTSVSKRIILLMTLYGIYGAMQRGPPVLPANSSP